MKIEGKEKEINSPNDLSPGDVFEHIGNYYMKIERCEDEDENIVEFVCLGDGRVFTNAYGMFDDGIKYLPNATLKSVS